MTSNPTSPLPFTTTPKCAKCLRTAPDMEWGPEFIPFGEGRYLRKQTFTLETVVGVLRLKCVRCAWEWLMAVAPPKAPA